MKFRHEYKHILNFYDYVVLKKRLDAVMKKDKHTGESGRYVIRSLYFDNAEDKALKEKIDGVNKREKFRLRFYNEDTSFIRLEKKSKINGLCSKEWATVTVGETEKIISGDIGFLIESENKLLNEFYFKLKSLQLRPKTIVEYTRDPYVFDAGNVRVTFDSHIKTGGDIDEFLNPICPMVPQMSGIYVLEVKYDEFIPSFITDIIHTGDRKSCAFSKYAASRVYL